MRINTMFMVIGRVDYDGMVINYTHMTLCDPMVHLYHYQIFINQTYYNKLTKINGTPVPY